MGLGSDYVFGNLKLRLAKLLPQLFTALLAKTMFTLGKTVPVTTGKLRQSPWGGIVLEKIQRDLRFQIRKDFQRPRVILFERDLDLIKQPSFVPPQPVMIPGEHLKLLRLFRVRLKSTQMNMIGPKKFRQHISVKGITLRLAHAKAISGPIQRLGIDRINHHGVVQKKIDDSSRWGFSMAAQSSIPSPLHSWSQRPNSLMPFVTLLDFHLSYFLSLGITDPYLVKFICPIHSQIVSLHFLFSFSIMYFRFQVR